LRWTDIEIRNHRLSDTLAPKPLNDDQNAIVDDDDLPPLEDGPEPTKKDSVNADRINQANANRHLLTPIDSNDLQDKSMPDMRTNFFDYRDDSSDDEDDNGKPKATHYNNLEELD
jgi:hypothetical protein